MENQNNELDIDDRSFPSIQYETMYAIKSLLEIHTLQAGGPYCSLAVNRFQPSHSIPYIKCQNTLAPSHMSPNLSHLPVQLC